MEKVGIFVGSFNPFTIGHDSIVWRALPLFDRLVIGVVGDNVHKPDMPSAEERIKVISDPSPRPKGHSSSSKVSVR